MLRLMMAFAFAIAAAGMAFADNAPIQKGTHRAAGKLPAGLPRSHYKFRTTVASPAPYPDRRPYLRPLPADDVPEVLFTPSDGYVPYVAPVFGVPLLMPGSSGLPGYYGSTHSYYYQGPYYGGPDAGFSYLGRLPYACGVYGYC